ncbi:MAG: hypothetical protein KY429_07680 [Actinobacteria bacterium]|nr:hypothetical protein [Actinomycetota bacterium]
MTRIVRFACPTLILVGLMLTLLAAAALVAIETAPVEATLPGLDDMDPKIGTIVHHGSPYMSPCGASRSDPPPSPPEGGKGGASEECRPAHSR